ncbi:MAG: glycine--tRNA ligase subunit beta, partial [Cytophagales bacterium]|nr:glycine--tRNA ligase subunit beta [Armatimonadota bacterium]
RHQADQAVEARGPGVKAAFDASGAPTKAAQGFATKQGIPVEALEVVGEYVVARTNRVGRAAGAVLAEIVPDLLKDVTFGKFMRWGAGNYRFGRPLRRFVALLDTDVVPFTVEGIASGRETVGHRFLFENQTVRIESPETYAAQLRAAFVEPDPAVRRETILRHARARAASVGGTAVLSDALVDENVYLTEWVTGVLGMFDAAYLSLPRPVLETAMKKHQRFFPVEGPQASLLPYFVAIRSGGDAFLETVRGGYEGVLASRFNDAKFFFDHDRQTTLAEKTDRTQRIVFQEKLGTLAAKTQRLVSILGATGLLDWTGDPAAAHRAAHLAKTDLATEIVMELPALQGIMGREFARMDGESATVADALLEQYLPRTAGDALPRSPVGTALSLSDRVDTLVGYLRFVGAEPKGSSDPFGLKRAAGVIVDLLARDRALPGLNRLLHAATEAYQAQGLTPAPKQGDLLVLLEARLRALLEERGARYDLVDALLASPWDQVASVVARAELLATEVYTANGLATVQAATRVRNILRSVKEPLPTALPPGDSLTTAEEKILLSFLETITPEVENALREGDYADAFAALAALSEPINRFFEGVLVMAEDPAVRQSRLGLLAAADRLYLPLADFSKLILE